MKNVLSDSQKYRLAKWLEANKDAGHTRTSACNLAANELAFPVTYSNMTSAEHTTGISLVKVPEVKADEDKVFMAVLLMQIMRKIDLQVPMQLHEICRSAVEIKPNTTMPTFCHKHG